MHATKFAACVYVCVCAGVRGGGASAFVWNVIKDVVMTG